MLLLDKNNRGDTMHELGQQFVIDYNNAKSKEKATFKGKKYRITVLTERLLRLEYNEEGIFEDRPTQLALFRNFDVPSLVVQQDERYLEITTRYFKLTYTKEKKFDSGPFLVGANLRVFLQNTEKSWYYKHPEVRNYFSTTVSLDNITNTVKLKKGLYSADGFASIDDSDSYVIGENGMVIPRPHKGLDIYLFMYRRDFGLCLRDYYDLTGKPALIPRYALGNWWSKEERYRADDINQLISDFEHYQIPLSVLLLDKDWHVRNTEDYQNLITGFSWNKQLFPTPSETIKSLHNRYLRLGLNINPQAGIYPHEEMYDRIATYLEQTGQETIKLDPLNPKFLDAYFKLLIYPHEMLGVDFFWIDYNDTKKTLLPLWILNHYHFLNMERAESRRGMLLSRNSLIAAHRYPVLYSGQTVTSWEILKLLPYFNSNSANIGISWWSHNIGGSFGGIEQSELYIRYVQLGVFSPILRFHSQKGKYYKRAPWLWDVKTLEIVRKYLNLRHRLIPYLYSEGYVYHKVGMPIIQPLYYKYPHIYDNVLYKNQYFLGTELLVAPITTKKDPVMDRVIHRFFIPDGIWYDFTTGKRFPGGKNYLSFYKDEEYPVFAKGGAIIPLANNININDTSAPKNMEIHVFPGRSNTYNLYEDDGISSLYKQGYYLLTSIDYNYRESNYTLIIRALEGKSGIIPAKRNYQIRFRNTRVANEVSVYYNDNNIKHAAYVDGPDFLVEIKDVPTIGQLTINCKGEDIEIDALRIINEDIDGIINDLEIETSLKDNIAQILFNKDLPIKKKRISIRKLSRQGLKPIFVRLFIRLLEYIEQI
jgi:alpha-glucosidase (family GH31 glycosyl hydrolase)